MNFTLTMTFYGSYQRKEWLTEKEWKYGLFGHPWRGEFVVIGQELIDMFDGNKKYLGIS